MSSIPDNPTLQEPTPGPEPLRRLPPPRPKKEGIGGFFANIGSLVGKIGEDVSDLLTLRIDLLKVELRDGAKTIAKNSVYVVAGAIIALFAFLVFTLAIITGLALLLPFSPTASIAAAAGIVFVLYAGIAVWLINFGIRHFKKHSIKPERSIQEVWKDKEWMKDLQKSATSK